MTVLLFFKPYLDNKMSIVEEYGAFKQNNPMLSQLYIIYWIFFDEEKQNIDLAYRRNCLNSHKYIKYEMTSKLTKPFWA